MFKSTMLAISAAAAIALAASAPGPAQAGSVHLSPAFSGVNAESNVIEVQRRGWRRSGRYHSRWDRRDRNALIGMGIGAAIVGGMLAQRGTPAYGYASSAWEMCAQRFRSLRPDGTYTTFDGRQVLCPYLR